MNYSFQVTAVFIMNQKMVGQFNLFGWIFLLDSIVLIQLVDFITATNFGTLFSIKKEKEFTKNRLESMIVIMIIIVHRYAAIVSGLNYS